MLGLVATLATVLGLGALGGGAEIARRNNLWLLQTAEALVLFGVALAAIALLVSGAGRSGTFLLILSVLSGFTGLVFASWAITQREEGRPAINFRMKRGPSPSLEITVKAGGLATGQSLNLLAKAYESPFGEDTSSGQGQQQLVREAFGPDPSGDASLVAEVPVPTEKRFKTIVIRSWVGDPGGAGKCLLQQIAGEVSGGATGPPGVLFKGRVPKTGCVIFSLRP
jgi:hypothetical protein